MLKVQKAFDRIKKTTFRHSYLPLKSTYCVPFVSLQEYSTYSNPTSYPLIPVLTEAIALKAMILFLILRMKPLNNNSDNLKGTNNSLYIFIASKNKFTITFILRLRLVESQLRFAYHLINLPSPIDVQAINQSS